MAAVTPMSEEMWGTWQPRLRLLWSRTVAHRLEFVVSLSIIVLGVYFLTPGWGSNAFSRTPGTTQAYAFMHSVMPEWAWGFLLLICGLVPGVGNVLDDHRLREIGMLLAVLCRVLLLFAIGSQTHWQSIVMAEDLVWSFVAIWAYWRVRP